MILELKAVYERGVIRPLQPVELPEGTRLVVSIIAYDQQAILNAAEILSEIAALPIEAPNNSVAGCEHDSIVYDREPPQG